MWIHPTALGFGPIVVCMYELLVCTGGGGLGSEIVTGLGGGARGCGAGLGGGGLVMVLAGPTRGRTGGKLALKVGIRDLAPPVTLLRKFLARWQMPGEAVLEIPGWFLLTGVGGAWSLASVCEADASACWCACRWICLSSWCWEGWGSA